MIARNKAVAKKGRGSPGIDSRGGAGHAAHDNAGGRQYLRPVVKRIVVYHFHTPGDFGGSIARGTASEKAGTGAVSSSPEETYSPANPDANLYTHGSFHICSWRQQSGSRGSEDLNHLYTLARPTTGTLRRSREGFFGPRARAPP